MKSNNEKKILKRNDHEKINEIYKRETLTKN